MRMSKCVSYLCCFLIIAIPVTLLAQSDVGGVTGTVTDASGAVVSNANVELKDLGTNNVNTAKTNQSGQYFFPRVSPGQYSVKVTAPGFSVASVPRLTVSVGKTALANLTLRVGEVSQVVEVQASGATELQTLDASVGNVINANQLANLPNLNRDATSLILLQPGTIPALNNTDENYGGQVAGARSDQNTFMIDGGDATSNTDANSAYSNNFSATPRGAIPTPVESLEEFRVITNNNVAGFNRSAGAEVQMVTKRGTNAWHGALYEYAIQDETNANSWTLNHLNEAKPEWRDNRFGARLGGPVFKDKTFFFLNWESRHFLRGSTVTRWAPTQQVRSGQIGYIDTSNNVRYVDIATLDPRGLGMNPAIKQIWNSMPLPTSNVGGDGVNFLNFTAPAAVTVNEETGVARLDHQITQNWHTMASYRYGVSDSITTNQVSITTSGVKALSARPTQPRYAVFGLTGQLTPNFTNDLHFDFLRHWWQWGTQGAKPQVAGWGGAVQLVNESVTSGVVPTNVDTQQARQRNWNGKDFNIIDNVSWVKGKHLVQFGGRFGWQRFNHLRNDKVTGGMTDPIYYSMWSTGAYNQITGIQAPADLKSTFRNQYRSAYVAMLGMVSQATQVLTRDGSLTPLPAGNWISQHSVVDNWQLNFADSWRLTPSLTVTYGLTWGVQLPPYEPSGTQTMEIDTSTGKIITVDQYLAAKRDAALAGRAYNPIIGFMPIKKTGRKYPFDPDYTNLGPRLAVAWNPSVKSDNWLGRIFGDRKTVIRAGWTRAFDRVNGVDIVMTPALGVGFADLGICRAPVIGGGCLGSSTPTNAFRIGVDGSRIAIPGLSPITAPVIPGSVAGANAPYSGRDWHIDPRRQIGSTDMFDLSIQREMPGRMLMEVGFIGRLSRDLYQKVDLNQIPYMYTMGGQSFADAFDKLQIATNNPNNIDANGNFILDHFAPLPFLEAALAGSSFCSGYVNCTQAVVDQEGWAPQMRDAFDMFNDLDSSWVSGSFIRFNNQVGTLDTTVSRGRANYAGMFASLRKGYSHGLTFDLNYTLSKSLDQLGWNQDIIDVMIDAYDANRSYGISQFDRRHVFNGVATWELPFGRGKRWASGGGIVDKVFGGWSTSYIFTASTGLPNYVYTNNACSTEYGDGGYYGDCVSLIPLKSGSFNMSRVDNSQAVSGGFGSQSAGGAYPSAWANPDAIAGNFRLPLFSDKRVGVPNYMRGLGAWNLDFSVSKTTHITEHVTTRFEAQLLNAFNHANLADPSTNIDNRKTFGVITGQANLPRYIQWGIRLDF